MKAQVIVVAALASLSLAAALPKRLVSSSVLSSTSTSSVQPSRTSSTAPSVTTWCALIELGPTVTAITPGTAVTGLQLTNKNRDGKATLTSFGYDTAISYTSGGLGFFDNCHEWWLNIGTSTNSWKPLSFGFDSRQSTNWVVATNNILTASATTSYATTSWFIACLESGEWVLYLQTGTSVPAGETCVLTQLQIGGSSTTVGVPTTSTSRTTTTTTTIKPTTILTTAI